MIGKTNPQNTWKLDLKKPKRKKENGKKSKEKWISKRLNKRLNQIMFIHKS